MAHDLIRSAQASGETFESSVRSVYARLQTALERVVGSVSGHVDSAVALQRAFGLERTLGWQLHNLLTIQEPQDSVARRTPGPSIIARFCETALAKGADPEAVRQLRSAADELDAVVARHAGSRTVFDAMLLGLSSEDEIDVATRKDAFMADSRLCGLTSATGFATYFMAPGDDPTSLRFATLRGTIGLRRLRASAFNVMPSRSATTNTGEDCDRTSWRPYEITDPDQPYVLSQFCTQPTPRFQISNGTPGWCHAVLDDHMVGTPHEISYVLGEWCPSSGSRVRADGDNELHAGYLVRNPHKVVNLDLIVQKGTFGPITPRGRAYWLHAPKQIHEIDPETDTIPVQVPISRVGLSGGKLSSPNIPRYGEMTSYVFGQMGWDPRLFEAFRVRFEYPIRTSVIRISFDLNDRIDEPRA